MDVFLNQSYKPMLIGREADPFNDDSYSFELKLDGIRALAYVSDQHTTLRSRNGLDLSLQFPEVNTLHSNTAESYVLDGELIALKNGIPSFEDVKTRALSKGNGTHLHAADDAPITFVVFDILYKNGAELIRKPFHERREYLESTVQETDHVVLSRLINGAGIAFFDAAKARGLEGIIAKRLDSLYHPGKRTNDWIKCKNLLDDDFIICGYIPNKNNTVSLVLGQYDNDHRLVYKGHVILGRAQKDYTFLRSLPETENAPSFTTPLPRNNENVIWVELKLVCRVTYLSQSENGLRHPVYSGLRVDKSPDETRTKT